ncbi:MAG: TonB-dependent receptor [Tepidisphaeraceae bacterium]|jgi:iron complex outermembrane receptor protein
MYLQFNKTRLICTVLLTLLVAVRTSPAQTSPATRPTTTPAASKPSTRPTTRPHPVSNNADLTNLSLEDLMNVPVISVSKTKQRLGDSAAAVTVITQEDIQRSGLRDIPEILRLSPGLFVQRGNQFTGWSISARGFGALFSDKLLVMVDGRTVYTPLFSGVYWNTVDYPIDDLDRIEVIRGPGATLYGANAMNGVINITTKSADETQGLIVDSRAGTDESDASVRYGGQIDDDTYYRVYAKGRSYDDLHESPTPVGDDNQWQDASSGFRIDRNSSDQDKLTLQGDMFDQSASDQLVTGHVISNYLHDYRSGENLLTRWTHVISDTSDYALQAYFDRIDFRDAYSTFRGDTFDVDFQNRFELMPSHELMYGLGGRAIIENVGTTALTQPVVNPDSDTTYLFSAFVQDTMTVVPDRLHLIAGSKFEQNSYTGFDVQPSARLLWTPTQQTSFWGAISRAVRTPSEIEWDESADIVVPTTPGHYAQVVKTTDKPQNEQLLAYEIGFRQQVTKRFSVDVTGFANNYTGLIALLSTGTTINPALHPPVLINSTYDNDQSARTYGTELSLNWQVLDIWRLQGSYSYLFANVHDYYPGITPDASAQDQSYPRNQFQLHSYLDVTQTLQLNGGIYYVDAIGNGNVLGAVGAPPGAYIRGDLGITWHPRPNLEVSAGIQNAFEPHHLEASFNATASADVDRAYYAQVAWRY